MEEDAINRALAGLRAQAHENHTREITLTREVARRLEQSNSEIIQAVEHAIDVHSEGRNKIAEKLIEATKLIGRLPAPRGTKELSTAPTAAAALPHETEDELKLY